MASIFVGHLHIVLVYEDFWNMGGEWKQFVRVNAERCSDDNDCIGIFIIIHKSLVNLRVIMLTKQNHAWTNISFVDLRFFQE